MFNVKIVNCTDICCSISNEDVCRMCAGKGHAVKDITLKQFVLRPLENYNGFYFCENPECDVVYFNNEKGIYLYKKDIKVKVGIKEENPPRPICYCFGFNIEDVKNNGENVVKEINKKIKESGCFCETANPSGKCCLADIKKLIKGEI
ncbi:putative iron-sulfur cluster-binding metallochaperone [Persephonella sp.]